MPWCEPCEAFYNPNTLHADGTCPRCGAQVGDPAPAETDADRDAGDSHRPARSPGATSPPPTAELDEFDDDEELVAKVPWHFWVGVVAMVVYLGWRLLQGIIWIF
jgi:hypothetical protein